MTIQWQNASAFPYLLVEGFVVFKEGLEGFEDLHLAGDAGRRLGLSLDHCHPQTALMAGHQALQMLQQQLENTAGIHLKHNSAAKYAAIQVERGILSTQWCATLETCG